MGYLEKRGLKGPWLLDGAGGDNFSLAVVIPALAESRTLPATLASLERNPADFLERTLVVAVVNNTPQAREADREDNRQTLAQLKRYSGPLRLAWVDAASSGRELPLGEGVGSARKIGFDLVLRHCRNNRGPPAILVSLDADTLVDENYLAAIDSHFRCHDEGGAVLPFRHRCCGHPAIDRAIAQYELFLRGYVLGLSWAGSPYAWHTIGSAIACRADAYVACGGMNRRPSAEDFYFVQQLVKTCGVTPLHGTVVGPSPRPSRRVPFGTGPTVAGLLGTPGKGLDFYPVEAFDILKEWLATMARNHGDEGRFLLDKARNLSPHLENFLQMLNFAENWRKLQRNHGDPQRLLAAFHGWFDGLRTRQLLHRLACNPFSWRHSDQSVPPLMKRLLLPLSPHPQVQLEILRCHQGAYPAIAGARCGQSTLFNAPTP
ncbi:MAG: hypothetical protein GXY54_08410 [Deltaproteobacteria bacterium]|nr:hypothetical protein [Deltaproteobacteria bacterium]